MQSYQILNYSLLTHYHHTITTQKHMETGADTDLKVIVKEK